ncbi:TonB-dependent receptor domain-containing protein [Flavobacterium sp.]|uniref:TonB-dependent receptor n=1 Tax=Flavobacterium sp. TaxID=239 RepID=UPI00286E65ED|nr:TonB-dependent receptor [Flavobacterium sp.]
MKKITLLLFLFNVTLLFAQKDISGKVTDASGQGIPGVNISEKGSSTGTTSDFDGKYLIKVQDGATLVFSYLGYKKAERSTANVTEINVTLEEQDGQQLEEVAIVGTRTAPRSNTTSALPIDMLSARDLTSTGQATFDKALQYRIPSFNTVQTPVNDATSLLDPYEIRNLGPSRTLILINGKRKNMSALVYTQTSPGRGETGSDISAIPTDAIERVEILRDGASAQYGSDAIAGVMNVILKKNTGFGSSTLRTGITSEGDGEMYGISLNNGSTIGNKGFINYTVDFSKVNLANRPGILNVVDEVSFWGADPTEVKTFLDKRPDGGNVNGSPETAAAKFLINGGSDLSENTQFYYNAAYVYKKVNSFANYRAPYWRSASSMPYLTSLYGNGTLGSYEGYVPTFIGDLNDYNATIGFKSKMNGWITDVSLTTGGNSQIYTVTNSQNRSYTDTNGNGEQDDFITEPFIYASDPNVYTGQTDFKPGGTSFNHYVGNLDISKVLSDKLSIGFGSEFRTENFEILAGDEASYIGSGADSFQGNRPENSGKFNRYNLGFYFDAAYDVTKDFLVNGTIRYENYSDFGDAIVWKLSSRYKLWEDKLTFRASASTGFRAPSLHQIYTEKSQSTFSGTNIVVTGITSNVSTTARRIGVPKLTPEKSTNYTLGFGFKPAKNFNLTVDYYNIKVSDRIVLGNLINFGATGEQAFFVNAIDSRTEGIDFVAGYRNISLGSGKLALNLSGNYTTVNRTAGTIRNPAGVQNLTGALAGQSVFNSTQNALMFTSRPQFKYIFGGDYEINKFVFSLNNTVFGPTKFNNNDYSSKDTALDIRTNDLRTVFLTKLVTDLGVTYSASEKLTVALNVNNLLNVLPEYKIEANTPAAQALIDNPVNLKRIQQNITFNGRYSQMTYDGYHFSQLGTMFNLSLNYKF